MKNLKFIGLSILAAGLLFGNVSVLADPTTATANTQGDVSFTLSDPYTILPGTKIDSAGNPGWFIHPENGKDSMDIENGTAGHFYLRHVPDFHFGEHEIVSGADKEFFALYEEVDSQDSTQEATTAQTSYVTPFVQVQDFLSATTKWTVSVALADSVTGSVVNRGTKWIDAAHAADTSYDLNATLKLVRFTYFTDRAGFAIDTLVDTPTTDITLTNVNQTVLTNGSNNTNGHNLSVVFGDTVSGVVKRDVVYRGPDDEGEHTEIGGLTGNQALVANNVDSLDSADLSIATRTQGVKLSILGTEIVRPTTYTKELIWTVSVGV
ncbi:MAG: WxL domain-containing protein [Lactobacillales bacterium]|jgi:hypothetical protein|nr:WxL domain-containing protein [Lactobacillales bacterium]